MDPQRQFCHNPDCSARGQVGQGNITIHSQKEQRRFGLTIDNLTAVDVVTLVLTLLCHGCPLQAIVAAFGFDERTVAQWQARGGRHCRHVHGHLVQQGQVDLGHVQADELWIKMVGKRVWMALALAVPSRRYSCGWRAGSHSGRHDWPGYGIVWYGPAWSVHQTARPIASPVR